MSHDDKKKPPLPTGTPVPPNAPDAKSTSPVAKNKPETKPKPLFRIVPADPKNSLNFEDTADK
jgi:hypothetical protein